MKFVDQPTCHPPSALFTIRVWYETLRKEPEAVRMQVKHVLSGETRYFRDWSQLTEYLAGKVQMTKQRSEAKGESKE